MTSTSDRSDATPGPSPAFGQLFGRNALRHLAGERSFERGAKYAAAGRVTRLNIGEEEISAVVQGARSYEVQLWIEDGGPGYSCTCPIGDEGSFCKHCVALALSLAEAPAHASAGVSRRDEVDLRLYLEGQDKARLIDLLLSGAEQDDPLRRRLLLEAAKAKGSSADLGEYRRAIQETINPGDYVDYKAMYSYSQDVEQVIGSVEALLAGGHASEVVELCEHALRCLEDAQGSVDDSDGYLGGLVEHVREIHHDACLDARPDPREFAARLFEWELHSESETFLGAASAYADVLGEDGLAEYRRLAMEVWSRVPPIPPGQGREHSTFRFRITWIMQTLAELSGDLDDLVTIKSRDLSSAYEFFQICELYRNAGRHDDALVWAERGLGAYPTHTDVRLREVLADEYHARGRHGDAMQLLWAELSDRPTLQSYQRLAEHAGRAGMGDAWRAEAIDLMRSHAVREASKGRQIPWGLSTDRSEIVRVFLWEGNLDAAWQEAREGGCSQALWLELASKREDDHPDDALPIYRRQVERLIGQKNNQAYAEAVAAIRRVQSAMAHLGRGAEFPAYVASVRLSHKAKRNLMKLLAEAGW
jgi:uncharacterized Zn finger protein